MKKTLLAITILTTLIFPVFAEDSASTTLTASAEPVTFTALASDRKPAVPLCAIGIDALFIGRVFPGISYTKVIDTNASYSIFAGAISDSKVFLLAVDVSAYYLINEYLYIGVGANAFLDENGYAVFGIANPAIGLISAVTDNISFYLESNLIIFTYRTKTGLSSHLVTDDPTPAFKMGVRYFF